MYTIIMNSDKSLITSVKTIIYQREKLVDKIQFLLPETYGDINIKDCIILLKYIDQGNIAHAEKLIIDDELYKEKVRCIMDVDTDLTRFSGDIIIHLSFLNLNMENGLHEEVMHSGETTIHINPISDIYSFVSDESLEIIDKAMIELEAKTKAIELMASTYDSEKADDICLNEESIHLTSHGNKIGTEIPLDTLGDSIADATDNGLIRVITEDEIVVPGDDSDTTVKYTLQLNQDTDELYLLMNGKVVSAIPTKDIGESIIDSTDEGLNEVITQ